MTDVRLAVVTNVFANASADREVQPAILVSYYYRANFFKIREQCMFRDWVLDSGAYSAHSLGKEIDLVQYKDFCQEALENDPTLTEVFSLDVIGDWKASEVNTRYLWDAGVPAIPTYHPGEPWYALKEMAAEYDKIALGGVVRWPKKKKQRWVEQCFARVYPKKIHGLGMASEELLSSVPFHSVDASSWEFAPTALGQWKSYNSARLGIRKQHPVRSEVEWFLALERKLKQKWAKEMARLEAV
jgi:hypothetical protein